MVYNLYNYHDNATVTEASLYISLVSFYHICSACCPIGYVGPELYIWVLIVRVRHAAAW